MNSSEPEVTRAKLALSQTRSWADPVIRAKRTEAIRRAANRNRGRPITDEHREAVTVAMRRRATEKRAALLAPWADRLEAMVCPEGEEFDEAGRAALAAFLGELYADIRRAIRGPRVTTS